MKRSALLLLCLFATVSYAQPAPQPTVTKQYVGRLMTGVPTPFPEDLKEANNGFGKALLDGDMKALEKYLVPDLIVFDMGRSAYSREQYIKQMARMDSAILKTRNFLTQPRIQVSIKGDSALMTASYSAEYRASVALGVTETLVYRKYGPVWQLQHLHRSWFPIASTAPKPADGNAVP